MISKDCGTMAKGVIYIYNGNTRRRREKVREETAETMMIENPAPSPLMSDTTPQGKKSCYLYRNKGF